MNKGKNSSLNLYQKKKRRILGEILRAGELRADHAWVAVHPSSKQLLLTYESEGLVVSVNGGGEIDAHHQQAKDAALLTRYVVERGGIILNGGRSAGIMAASAQAAGDRCLGVIFPELQNQASQRGANVIVNSPTPRIELLATCAPIMVIFRGGLGTLMVLLRAIVHLKNRQYHPEQLPQLVFVSDYWIGLLTTMMNLGALPREFLEALRFFHEGAQILEQIPPFEKGGKVS